MDQKLVKFPQERAEMGPWQTIKSAHFRERARQYRLAAALTDSPRDAETYCDLAMLFNDIARDFRRLEARTRAAGFLPRRTV